MAIEKLSKFQNALLWPEQENKSQFTLKHQSKESLVHYCSFMLTLSNQKNQCSPCSEPQEHRTLIRLYYRAYQRWCMFRLLNRILQTVITNSRHRKQLFENAFNSVTITAGWNKSSQDNTSSCIPAVIVPPQQTDYTNRAFPIKMTKSQLNAESGILKQTDRQSGSTGKNISAYRECIEEMWVHFNCQNTQS